MEVVKLPLPFEKTTQPLLVAFIGYSRTGKDEAARPLIESGWKRINFADGIKIELADAIHTKLVRPNEAADWRSRGGLIFEIRRSGVGPATPWEEEQMVKLKEAIEPDCIIDNDTDVLGLHNSVKVAVGFAAQGSFK